MNLLALLLGLAVERLVTHLFHLREFRWLDPLFDAVLTRLHGKPRSLILPALVLLVALLVVPVAVCALLLWDALLQIPYFFFAVLVLLFSLGPRDLDDEVTEFCAAAEGQDPAEEDRLAKELLECDPPATAREREASLGRAVYVQASNRIFGVVFWFVALGPTGAWLFRTLDLLRRRASFVAARRPGEAPAASVLAAVRLLHGLVAWIPSRLQALGFALAGDFEEAITGWRDSRRLREAAMADRTETLLASVGVAASGLDESPERDPDTVATVRAAMGLVTRTLWLIWCPVIAIMTLADWLS